MPRRWLQATVITSISAMALTVPASASAVLAGVHHGRDTGRRADAGQCSAGAHTLSHFGAHLYPDTGNGGYTSVHTDVDLVYDATTNMFLPGNHVVLTDLATQCLTSFSLDFERNSDNLKAGPDMAVRSVSVNGQPAAFSFVQPTYPGDPHGPSDPDPAAHEASQDNPVGGPQHNRLPPACSPELLSTNPAKQDSLNGTQCPANKLVVTPQTPIKDGATFTVTVSYTGRPGLHNDGDGTTEGWFRSSDGGFVTTEPVASQDWMPLNDYPTAKPTYDFYDTVNAGKTVIANGILEWTRQNKPNADFPNGSVTWHWHSRAPIASYLVEDSVGDYDLTERTADNGIQYYEAQDASISPARQKKNLAIMNQQENITEFESQFNGTYPFTSDGVVVGTPPASFEEEMQTMITFAGGQIGLSVFYHENMHQWWGDNVTEGGYDMTFYKEGMATVAQYLLTARQAETAAGGPQSAKGQAAFQASLVHQFNETYAAGKDFWNAAPSNPTPYGLFATPGTYARPAAAYLALRQILGSTNFTQALQQIQRDYGGASITEPQLEAAFHQWMPNQSGSCQAKLSDFFTEWFDTAYPSGGGANQPQITGPGLSGPGFYNTTGGCTTTSTP
jgi:hypothetical protein